MFSGESFKATLIKVAFSLVAAFIVTMFCFYLMYLLIATDIKPAQSQRIELSVPMMSAPLAEKPREVRKSPEKKLPAQPPSDLDSPPLYQAVPMTTSDFSVLDSPAELMDQEALYSSFAPRLKDLLVLKVVRPLYPMAAVMRRIEGHVVVEFTVQKDGSVGKALIVESVPEDIFDAVALSAIQQFRFQPPEVDGNLMTADAVLRFAFRLDNGGKVSVE